LVCFLNVLGVVSEALEKSAEIRVWGETAKKKFKIGSAT